MRFLFHKILLASAFLAALDFGAAAEPRLSAPGGGVVRALIVGINDYYRMPQARLHGAVADAQDIANALNDAGVAGAKSIVDRDATRKRIVEELGGLVKEAKAGDLVIISFAGHGMQVSEYEAFKGLDREGVNEQIALAGFAFSGEGVGEILVNKELKAYLARLDAKGVDVVVVMDSCFGGGMSRAIDPRSGEWTIRSTSGTMAKADHDKFVPVPMVASEARAEVRAMTHVTFLAGATKDTVVPEIPTLDPNGPRGALSYFVAKAIRGEAATSENLTREAFIKFVRQKVEESSGERQRIEFEPRTNDPAVLQRVALHFGPRNLEIKPDLSPAVSLAQYPVRVAVIGGAPGALGAVVKGKAPFEAATSPATADLVWDVGKQDAIALGDKLLDRVDASLLGGVIDRTWTFHAIERLSEARVLQIALVGGGKLYVPGDNPTFVASGLVGTYLTVFNIAATGQVQMIYPYRASNPRFTDDEWSFSPNVTVPYGADQLVALTSAAPPAPLLTWLEEHDQLPDAALVPAIIKKLIDDDPSVRIGTVGLHTAPNK